MKISLSITLILFYSSLISQTSPNFNYQLCLGGSSNDQIYAIDKSKDGGLILGLHSTSSDGDLSFNYGLDDIWIVKLDTLNNITWEKNIGGSSFDYVYSIKETLEGGVIVLGSTSSIDFDVIGNHGSYDIWLVKLDSVGNITWQKCIGGSQTDIGNQIQLLQDSSFVIVGWSNSIDGDMQQNHGMGDVILAKIDKNGSILWLNNYGGSNSEAAQSVNLSYDGGFIVGEEEKERHRRRI